MWCYLFQPAVGEKVLGDVFFFQKVSFIHISRLLAAGETNLGGGCLLCFTKVPVIHIAGFNLKKKQKTNNRGQGTTFVPESFLRCVTQACARKISDTFFENFLHIWSRIDLRFLRHLKKKSDIIMSDKMAQICVSENKHFMKLVSIFSQTNWLSDSTFRILFLSKQIAPPPYSSKVHLSVFIL